MGPHPLRSTYIVYWNSGSGASGTRGGGGTCPEDLRAPPLAHKLERGARIVPQQTRKAAGAESSGQIGPKRPKPNIFRKWRQARTTDLSVARGYGDRSPLTTAATLEWRRRSDLDGAAAARQGRRGGAPGRLGCDGRWKPNGSRTRPLEARAYRCSHELSFSLSLTHARMRACTHTLSLSPTQPLLTR